MNLRIYLIFTIIIQLCTCANILMISILGTKSHNIPFWELARGLLPRGHNVTFVSPFPADFTMPGLQEVTPSGLAFYVKKFTDTDLLGARMRGREPVRPIDLFKYAYEACDELLSNSETRDLIHSGPKVDLLILDGAYPECALGFVHNFKVPFMYINTMPSYTGQLSLAGNPTLYSVTPWFARSFTDTMNLLQRTTNTLWHLLESAVRWLFVRLILQNVLRNHFGNDIPPIYDISKNVSFILQNGYSTITYPRPYLPNVAEIGCIQCKQPGPLSVDLEEFINGSGNAGFILFSMGSSVKAANMPEYLKKLFLGVFRQLPQRVLWKWEEEEGIPDLPANVKLGRWLPQQDLLGHRKIRAFVTHGGLLSMFEAIYHGVPIVTIPVYTDHDSNAAKAALDGYAIKLDLSSITAKSLLTAIRKIINDPKYTEDVKRRQMLLKDQKETPLDRAVFWTEYVLRHRGAKHLQSNLKDLNIFQYYLIDVTCVLVVTCLLLFFVFKLLLTLMFALLSGNLIFKKLIKSD